MNINNTIDLVWEGKPYSLLVTMKHIDEIERDINLLKMTQQCAAMDLRLSHVAKLVSIILNQAGAKTTQEAVYKGMFDGTETKIVEVIDMMHNILGVLFFESKKKPEPTLNSETITPGPTSIQ